jgi:tRNA(Phe) wybutosine-synthesizing methylase Tyw3
MRETILELPEYLAKYRPNNPETVCIDTDIVPVIKILWANNIVTLGSCCGHGKDNPSIVISSDYDNNGIKWIISIISSCDKRTWDIFQWRLCKVSKAE